MSGAPDRCDFCGRIIDLDNEKSNTVALFGRRRTPKGLTIQEFFTACTPCIEALPIPHNEDKP